MAHNQSQPKPGLTQPRGGAGDYTRGVNSAVAFQGKSLPFKEDMNKRLRVNDNNTHIPFIERHKGCRRNIGHDTTSEGNPTLGLTVFPGLQLDTKDLLMLESKERHGHLHTFTFH